jgi:epoxyqueuosine reductase
MTHSFLSAQLEEQGYQARIVRIQRLYELREEIESRYRQGLFDEQFYQENLTSFDFAPPGDLPEARSLIIVAVPRSQFQLVFNWRGKALPVLVPSHYLHWPEAKRRLLDSLATILAPSGSRVARANLPEKLLAARSGLGQYGKNNVCYVPGMGSFHRLVAFYSDLACHRDDWQEAQMLERCQNCSACLRKCPTGAITAERFVIHAERCITWHNEQPGDVPFPVWLEPGWHNCLIGCARCQNVCPQNKDFRRVKEGAEFSEKETALLLEGVPLDQLPAATAEKLARSGLGKYADLLPRNLGALFNDAEHSS